MKTILQACSAIVAMTVIVGASRAQAASISGHIGSEAAPGQTLVVYLEDAPSLGGKSPGEHPKIAQRNSTFDPAVAVVVKGGSIDFPNEDKIFHNVFSATAGSEFDLGLYRGGASKANQFTQVGEVDVYCNVHENMRAKVLVVPNAYFARVGDDGNFELRDVPPGEYSLVAWSSAFKPQKKKVNVPASGAKVDLKLSEAREDKAHLNKDGEHYGRYK